ncbi:MAG: exosortase [Burkholderiales bacterium]|nr:exosortase [Burkholderiales bacterium]MDE2433387.1 exosortase [Burkholderiales bacterium]
MTDGVADELRSPAQRWLLAAGWASLAVPTLWDFMVGQWSAYSQGHEFVLLGVVGWLLWRKSPQLNRLPLAPIGWLTWLGWAVGLMAYTIGRTQEFIRVELLAVWWMALMVLRVGWGPQAWRQTWFIWLFALFMIPLPFSVVLALTAPLKEAVSAVATVALRVAGYPIARTGVVITVGQYQLLVAEACAGLQSMFVLEAMGLLYSYLVQHRSWWRNALLAACAVPVSFAANVVRVMTLVWVTYHFGDATGQGFVHNFAGLVLFGVALALLAGVDAVLGWWWPDDQLRPDLAQEHRA